MCGIAAIFGLKDPRRLSRQILAMTEIIRHRGPDDEGYALFPKQGSESLVFGGRDTPEAVLGAPYAYCPRFAGAVDAHAACTGAMGHRRLSILDLSPAGHQPMCSDDGKVWVTYNGEVYNFVEIREELKTCGHRFATGSDTEVMLKAYAQWGIDCLHRFNGMFSFVLYDRNINKVFAVRDRFGVKPLYYWIAPEGWIAFASEIKQFTVLDGWRAARNPQRVYDFLVWGVTNHTEETLFSGVRQLRGGEYLELTPSEGRQNVERRRWYRLEGKRQAGSYAETSRAYAALLEDAVRLRLRADVEVGSCLSGGLDSSAIVCLANQLGKEKSLKQSTFSACANDPRYDERLYIDEVVRRTGVRAHYTFPSLDTLFEDAKEIVWHQDEPFPSTSMFAQWHVFRKSRQESVKVMLDGQGADEQLGGYHGFFGNRFYDLLIAMQWMQLLNEMKATKRCHPQLSPLSMLAKKMVPNSVRAPLEKLFRGSVVRPDWLNFSLLQVAPKIPFEEKGQGFYDQSLLQLTRSSLPMLLHFEDRNSMAHSIESRTPFLDYRLVEFTLGLPTEYKVAQGWTKRILRESMKGVLPEKVRLRGDKMGFVTPEEVWLKKEGPEAFRRQVDTALDASQGIILPSFRDKVDAMIAGSQPFSFLPWRVICFGIWMEQQ